MSTSNSDDFQRSIDDIVEEFKTAKGAGRRNCCLLIGAGCSVSAGIPTAAGFVEIIKDRHPRAYDRAAEKSYAQCMAQLSPSQRRLLITEYVDKAKINWAHVSIALLIQHGFIDRVLTTNFDPLVSRACSLIGEFPAVYDFAASQLLRPADIPDKAVFHLHGQYTGFVLMNTQQDMDEHSQRLGSVFEDAGRGRMWVVVGYSGENDPVFNHLVDVARFDDNLYWVGYQNREAPIHVKKHLLVPGKYAFFTSGYDADSFFIELAQKLDIFPPDFVRRPFSHLDSVMGTLAPFPLGSEAPHEDVTREARKLIGEAISQFEEGTPIEVGEDAGLETTPSVSALDAYALLMKADYDAVIALREQYDRNPSSDLADPLSTAYVMRGVSLTYMARELTDEQAAPFFEQAVEKFENALSINPENSLSFIYWANALIFWARKKGGQEADKMLEEAESKSLQAEEMEPGRGSYNLACLSALRGDESGAQRWLLRAKDTGKLASLRHIMEDLDLDSVRETSWFKEMFAEE